MRKIIIILITFDVNYTENRENPPHPCVTKNKVDKFFKI